MNRAWLSLAVLSAALAAPVAAQAPGPAFRIGYLGAASPCATPGARSATGQAAYAAHLSARLKRPVQLCGFPAATAAAAALASGGLEMAMLDAAAYAPHRDSVRTILTGRAGNGPGRVLTVLLARTADARARASDFAGARVVVAGTGPLLQAGPLKAMSDAGVQFAAAPGVAAGGEAALAALRAGQADAALLDAASVTRNCRADDGKSRPCADFKEIWRGRPRPALAWAVRRDLPEADRFQLIGIHIALHQEAPAAMPFARAGMAADAVLLEPTEALALIDASQKVRAW